MKYLIMLCIMSVTLWGIESNKEPIVVGKKLISKNTLHSHTITMNLPVLEDIKNFNDKTPILIDLDSNTTITFIPKRFKAGKKKGDFSWVAKSKDSKAKAILSIRNGVMIGTITYKKDTYKLYPENGYFKVTKVDKTKAIPFYNDTITPVRKIMLPPVKRKDDLKINKTIMNQLAEPAHTIEASVADINDSVINVLIYYTQALKDEYGTNTEAMIQNNFDLAKDAYIDSDTEINLQIAAIKLVPAGSLLSTANSEDLNDLLGKLKSDGLIRYERVLYNADAVTVFSKYPDNATACGLGYIPNQSTSSLLDAYSSVHIKPSYLGGYYCSDLSFAHELGHNFGCMHDADHTNYVGMYPYAYGYDVADGNSDVYGNPTYHFGTIMSYDRPAISYFSNPNLMHTDGITPIGDASSADNARAIRENQFKMADNSEQINEDLEVSDNDVLNAYTISGNLNNSADRDAYVVWLDGNTTFDKSYHGLYMNIYNENTHQLITSSYSDITIVLSKDKYRVVVAFSSDETGYSYSSSSTPYSIGITTEYVAPSVNPEMSAIINYLLN